jgi:hypothetical protein
MALHPLTWHNEGWIVLIFFKFRFGRGKCHLTYFCYYMLSLRRMVISLGTTEYIVLCIKSHMATCRRNRNSGEHITRYIYKVYILHMEEVRMEGRKKAKKLGNVGEDRMEGRKLGHKEICLMDLRSTVSLWNIFRSNTYYCYHLCNKWCCKCSKWTWMTVTYTKWQRTFLIIHFLGYTFVLLFS